MAAQVVLLLKLLRTVLAHHDAFVDDIFWARLPVERLPTMLMSIFLTSLGELLSRLTRLLRETALSTHVDLVLLVHIFEYLLEGWVPNDFVATLINLLSFQELHLLVNFLVK